MVLIRSIYTSTVHHFEVFEDLLNVGCLGKANIYSNYSADLSKVCQLKYFYQVVRNSFICLLVTNGIKAIHKCSNDERVRLINQYNRVKHAST